MSYRNSPLPLQTSLIPLRSRPITFRDLRGDPGLPGLDGSSARTKTGTIGDGSSTQIDIAHNWNTRAVNVEVYRNSGSYDTIECDVSRPDANTVRLNFAAAPSSAAFAYVLHTSGTA